MTFLQLIDIEKRYANVQAVAGVSLSVANASRTAIVGPSGSGKTTLLRLIAGFERPDRGRMTLGGDSLAEGADAMPSHLRNIGIVAQEGALFPHLDVAANIGFGLQGSAAAKAEIVLPLMDMVGLARSMATRMPDQLSGGQQQRVALARALARKPRLMLLDEPFSALDAGLRVATRKAVTEVLDQAGITTILVTHDQTEALAFGDHLGVMRDGRLVQFGAPRDLYLRPADATTATFLGDAIILPADIRDGMAHCALGRIATGSPTAKGAGRVMLRPEQLQITPLETSTPETGHAALQTPGTIRRIEFSGSSYDMDVAVTTDSGEPMIITLRTPTRHQLAPGERVGIEVFGKAHVFA